MKKMNKDDLIFGNIANIIGILIVILSLYPIYYVVIASLSQPFYVDNGDVLFTIKGFNLESYKNALKVDGLWLSYGNAFFYTIVGVLTNMLFTSTMAYALSKKRLPLRTFFTFMAVFTMWFNAGIIPFYMNIVDLHLLNTRTAIIVAFSINAYNLIILKSFFEQVPPSLEEAAFIDGASNLRIFWEIFLPLSKPALATVSMFYVVTRWNGYFWAMNLLRDDTKIPLQVLLKKIIVDQVATMDEASIITVDSLSSPTTEIYALIIIAIIPMLIAYPFVQKYFKEGATVGAVKG